MPIAVAALGLVAGLWLRARATPRYASYFRLQLLLIVVPLSCMGGWSLRPTLDNGAALLIVLGGEMLGVALGWATSRRGHHPRFFAVSTSINSSTWSLPAALALFGPGAATFTVLFDSLLAPVRNSLLIWMMRSSAPTEQYGKTAFVDYSRSIAAVAGLVLLAVAGHPPAAASTVIEIFGYAAGVCGFALFGVALPRSIPKRAWREALAVMPLRFLPVTGLLLVAEVAGLRIPNGAWVLALAPCWFSYLAWSRLYGHDGEFAAATNILSLLLALGALPIVALLGS